jgi:1-acyl-sn-glycerol-3-phosphate acyltransferase
MSWTWPEAWYGISCRADVPGPPSSTATSSSTMLRTLIISLLGIVCILVLGGPLLVFALLTGNTGPLYAAGLFGARLSLRLGGVRIEVRGRERIPTGRAVVFMPNHQSYADPPAIFAQLPPVLVLAKKEFFRIPILGWAMKRRGFIPVDRSDRDRAIQAVEGAVTSLKAGNSFLVYPEGTRSPDGRLQRFKKGAFMMAIHAGAPIVPVSISGAARILPKGSRAVRPGCVRITFHDPVPTDIAGESDRVAIMAVVQASIMAGLSAEEWPAHTASLLPDSEMYTERI